MFTRLVIPANAGIPLSHVIPTKFIPTKVGTCPPETCPRESGERGARSEKQESPDSRILTDFPSTETPACAGMTTVYMTSGISQRRADSLTSSLKKAAPAEKDGLLKIILQRAGQAEGAHLRINLSSISSSSLVDSYVSRVNSSDEFPEIMADRDPDDRWRRQSAGMFLTCRAKEISYPTPKLGAETSAMITSACWSHCTSRR